MKPRLWVVCGNHAVNDVPPGDKFEAAIPDDHPWIVGGHVKLADKPKRAKEAAGGE